MKSLVRTILALGGALAFVIPAHSQQDVCAGNYVTGFYCGGPNNCSQYITLRYPDYGSGSPTCLEGYYVYCCSSQYEDYSDTGDACSDVCDDAVKAILKDPDAAEFTWTHTLWAKDCSGHYGPFSRTWDITPRPIDLRPRLSLSGIGG